jgi:hypothetical protein
MSTITATIVEIKKDLETPFLNMSPAELEYRNNNFIKNGKILFTKMDMSADKLTRKVTTIFLNEQARLEYRNDPVISDFRNRKLEYNRSKNIEFDMSFDMD